MLDIEKTKQGFGKQLTVKGTFCLAIRRNFSNVATADIGALLLEDISRFTVVRSECKAGNALVASARLFYHWLYVELTSPCLPETFRLVVHSYRQDATNSGILKRSKLNALILHTACLRQHRDLKDLSWNTWGDDWNVHDWFDTIIRVADVLPVRGSTSETTVSQTLKHLASLGCMSWKDIQQDPDLSAFLSLTNKFKDVFSASLEYT